MSAEYRLDRRFRLTSESDDLHFRPGDRDYTIVLG